MIKSAQFLQREYKKSLEQEIKGKGMLALATETPDFLRAKNATDILSQVQIIKNHLQPIISMFPWVVKGFPQLSAPTFQH